MQPTDPLPPTPDARPATPAPGQKDEAGWVVLYAGIVIGMLVVAAAAVAAVVLIVRR